jgi:hypothetical protein
LEGKPMKVRFLEYIGAKEESRIVVRQGGVLSNWRNINVHQGWRKKIGFEIPERIANFLLDMRKDIFNVVEEDVDCLESMKEQIDKVLDLYEEEGEAVFPAVNCLLIRYGREKVEEALENLPIEDDEEELNKAKPKRTKKTLSKN